MATTLIPALRWRLPRNLFCQPTGEVARTTAAMLDRMAPLDDRLHAVFSAEF